MGQYVLQALEEVADDFFGFTSMPPAKYELHYGLDQPGIGTGSAIAVVDHCMNKVAAFLFRRALRGDSNNSIRSRIAGLAAERPW